MRRILFSLLIYLPFTALCQEPAYETTERHLVKASVYPFIWAASKQNFWITIHYESALSKKLTYNLVADCYKWNYKQYLANAGIYTEVKNNQIFYFRPQVRYYFGKEFFRGYYLGGFPLYTYQEKRYESKYGHYMGFGILAGYQLLVKNKVSVEVNVWLATHSGRYNQLNSVLGIREKGSESFEQLGFELNIGRPFKQGKESKGDAFKK